jgi:hypothetical protein
MALPPTWWKPAPARLVHALNKSRHAERLEASSLNAVYLWGV